MTVVLTRSHARELDLDVGSKVWLSPNRGALTMPSAGRGPPSPPPPSDAGLTPSSTRVRSDPGLTRRGRTGSGRDDGRPGSGCGMGMNGTDGARRAALTAPVRSLVYKSSRLIGGVHGQRAETRARRRRRRGRRGHRRGRCCARPRPPRRRGRHRRGAGAGRRPGAGLRHPRPAPPAEQLRRPDERGRATTRSTWCAGAARRGWPSTPTRSCPGRPTAATSPTCSTPSRSRPGPASSGSGTRWSTWPTPGPATSRRSRPVPC